MNRYGLVPLHEPPAPLPAEIEAQKILARVRARLLAFPNAADYDAFLVRARFIRWLIATGRLTDYPEGEGDA